MLGILRSGTWGFVQPKPEAPEWLGLSPVIWLLLAGGVVLALFLRVGEPAHRARRGRAASTRRCCATSSCATGVTSFLFLFLVQAGIFFVVPLFLSVALGLSAIETGVRLLPLSLTLLLFAAGIPKVLPDRHPRRVVRLGFVTLFAGLVLLVGLLDIGAGPGDRDLAAAARGCRDRRDGLAARGRDRVGGARRAERRGRRAPEHGTQLGASIGTALAGAVLISALTASFFTGIKNNPAVPDSVASKAQTELAGGVPFISDDDLKAALSDAHVPPETADAIVEDERAEPDRRAARRTFAPGAPGARRPSVHPRHPDRPARCPIETDRPDIAARGGRE